MTLRWSTSGLAALVGGSLVMGSPAFGQSPQTFDSPEAAMAALLEALTAQDDAAVLEIFGPEYEEQLLGEDLDAAHEEQARFVAAATASLELRPDGEGRRIVYVGPRATPLPIPRSGRRGVALRYRGRHRRARQSADRW
jgi:hypothetical protein